MRKLAIAVVGLLAAGYVVVANVVAQDASPTIVHVDAKVTPNKAGTKKKPQAVKLSVKSTWNTPGDGEKPIVQSAKVFFPVGSLYNGAKYPKCSQNLLARNGPAACPKGSIMGKGGGSAFADQVITHPRITVVNGGANRVYLFTVLDNPARVQAPVPGVIKKLNDPKWAYELDLTVPKVLQIVAGVPIALRDITITSGSSSKDWLATTGCKGGKWPFVVETFYSTGGSSKYEDSIPCKA
jgi:hypothetical protein